jgi:hypothetical protein
VVIITKKIHWLQSNMQRAEDKINARNWDARKWDAKEWDAKEWDAKELGCEKR